MNNEPLKNGLNIGATLQTGGNMPYFHTRERLAAGHRERDRSHHEYERRKANIKAVTSAEYEAEIKEIVEELGL